MITRFAGKNVGGFENVSLELEPLTILVGPNASGKSTLLRALRALALLTRSPLYDQRTGVIRLAGMATLADLFRNPARDMELSVAVERDGGKGQYEIALGYDEARGRVEVRRELAKWSSPKGDDFAFDSDADRLEFAYRGSDITTDVPRRASLPHLAFPFWKQDPIRYSSLRGLYSLVACFSPFHVYRFSPGAIAQAASPTDPVSYDGGGLAAALDRLLGEDRAAFDSIVSDLKAQFDHLQELRIHTVSSARGEPLKLLQFEEKGGRRIPAGFESDGVLLTLAYSWLGYQQTDPAVGVEEPETAAYPSLVRERLRLIYSLVHPTTGRSPVQVVATTHSPFLLSAVGRVKAVRVCERATRVYQPPEQSMSDVIHTRLNWSVEG